ncbi:di/tripeptide permease YjdL [Klebsiella pneumoniae]|uniref:Di/tripeptide permease YjdL n=1 Tax=Klebsiella pneumoniae TaxID=573 RepID=A0A377TME2_KLEPN|nr:di/tripeptide permease YjdL [Klebsiella pneumoniae]
MRAFTHPLPYHQLGFDDSHAISLFSAYASLVYVTPILGGCLADRLLGNRTAVIAGALLMTLGHVVLALSRPPHGVCTSRWRSSSAATACLNPISAACSANCTLTTTRVATAVSRCCTPPATSGSIAAPIACGLAAQWYGWHIGFALAGIGMFIGLMIFLSGSRHFRHTRGVDKPALRAVKFVLPTWGWLLVMLCLAPVFFTLLAAKQLVRLSAGDRLPVRRPGWWRGS